LGTQCAWLIKCRAVIKQNYIDDIELDDQGVAEVLMDDNAVASVPRYKIAPVSFQLAYLVIYRLHLFD
jgi:hypothetical protein